MTVYNVQRHDPYLHSTGSAGQVPPCRSTTGVRGQSLPQVPPQ